MGFLSEAFGIVGDVLGISELGPNEAAEDRMFQQQAFAREQAERNEALQREFAKHGVSWRVEDALDAGVHPLFALSAGGAAFAPNPIVIPEDRRAAPVGQRVGGTIDQYLAREAALETAAAAADKDRAQAEFYRSEAARARQAATSSKPLSSSSVVQGVPNVGEPMEGYYDRRVVQANPTFSRDSNFPSVGAGSSPAFRSYELMPGKIIDLPHTEEGPSEALENLTVTSWPFVIAHNVAHYGPQWIGEMASILTPFLDAARDRAHRAVSRIGFSERDFEE